MMMWAYHGVGFQYLALPCPNLLSIGHGTWLLTLVLLLTARSADVPRLQPGPVL